MGPLVGHRCLKLMIPESSSASAPGVSWALGAPPKCRGVAAPLAGNLGFVLESNGSAYVFLCSCEPVTPLSSPCCCLPGAMPAPTSSALQPGTPPPLKQTNKQTKQTCTHFPAKKPPQAKLTPCSGSGRTLLVGPGQVQREDEIGAPESAQAAATMESPPRRPVQIQGACRSEPRAVPPAPQATRLQ